MITILPVRDKVKLRYVSRRLRRGLRSASETPSLWKDFVWPCYHTGDESCMNNVLKVCGRHVKRLSFSNHVTFSKLVRMLDYCSNVMELSLSTTKLGPDQLGKGLQRTKHIQKLDIQWGIDIGVLLELIGMDLKELTVREEKLSSRLYELN